MKRALTALTLALSIGTASYAAEKVVAEVNGKKITEKEVNQFINSLPPQYNALKKDPNFKKRVVENMVKEELLYQEALKEGLDKDPEVQREIERAKKRILVQALLRKTIKPPKVEVSEKEAKEFYEKNKKQFVDANGKPIPFQQLKPFIIQSLKQQKEEQAVNAEVEKYIKSLESKSKVVINEK
jgi:peptidyl-prolyl cis-trans isomerase C